MSKVKFKLNSAGVRNLLRSQEMQTVIEGKVSEIQGRCGNGYEQEVKVGRKRVYGQVYTDTIRAKKDNAKNNTLLKAVR